MPDYAVQRLNMVDTQVKPSDVVDPRIHSAMSVVARDQFVPAAKRAVSYADMPVEIAQGRFLSDPRTFAKLLQLASIRATDKVLDVGCATGYSSAVIAQIAGSVIALEQDADLIRIATDLLRSDGATNVTVVQGALTDGFKQEAPYDVIFINGMVENVPQMLLNQLAEGGRLVAVVRQGPLGRARIYLREKGHFGSRDDFDSSTPLLAGFHKAVGFVF